MTSSLVLPSALSKRERNKVTLGPLNPRYEKCPVRSHTRRSGRCRPRWLPSPGSTRPLPSPSAPTSPSEAHMGALATLVLHRGCLSALAHVNASSLLEVGADLRAAVSLPPAQAPYATGGAESAPSCVPHHELRLFLVSFLVSCPITSHRLPTHIPRPTDMHPRPGSLPHGPMAPRPMTTGHVRVILDCSGLPKGGGRLRPARVVRGYWGIAAGQRALPAAGEAPEGGGGAVDGQEATPCAHRLGDGDAWRTLVGRR